MALNLVPSSFWRFPSAPSLWEDFDAEDWLPALPSFGMLSGLSLSEDDKNVYVEAAVPGVDPKDVDITFHKGVLWIKGEAKEEEKKKKYYRKASSAFSYRVTIPEEVDEKTEPQAVYSKGMMKITFAKSPKTQPKKISVKSGEEEEKKIAAKK